jgi:hypothetical protein
MAPLSKLRKAAARLPVSRVALLMPRRRCEMSDWSGELRCGAKWFVGLMNCRFSDNTYAALSLFDCGCSFDWFSAPCEAVANCAFSSAPTRMAKPVQYSQTSNAITPASAP